MVEWRLSLLLSSPEGVLHTWYATAGSKSVQSNGSSSLLLLLILMLLISKHILLAAVSTARAKCAAAPPASPAAAASADCTFPSSMNAKTSIFAEIKDEARTVAIATETHTGSRALGSKGAL
jgi:hypothetical protein